MFSSAQTTGNHCHFTGSCVRVGGGQKGVGGLTIFWTGKVVVWFWGLSSQRGVGAGLCVAGEGAKMSNRQHTRCDMQRDKPLVAVILMWHE